MRSVLVLHRRVGCAWHGNLYIHLIYMYMYIYLFIHRYVYIYVYISKRRELGVYVRAVASSGQRVCLTQKWRGSL